MMKHLTIFLIVISFLSCKKEDCAENTSSTEAITSCLHNYIFDTGSYWIYKNTTTLSLDSTFITNVENEWTSSKNISGACGTHITTGQTINTSYNSSLRNSYNESIKGSNTSTPYGELFLCNANTVDSIVTTTDTYYNVLDISLGSVRLFYKESIGVIRRVEYNPPIDTSTYDLINHQVNLFQLP